MFPGIVLESKKQDMNILFITGIFPPDIGGPASYVPKASEALAAKGHRVSVLTLADDPALPDGDYPFPVIRIRRSLPRPLRVMATIKKIVAAGEKADVLYVHGLAMEAVAANYLLKKPLVQKIVGDLAWEKARTLGRTAAGIEDFQKKRHPFSVELLKSLRSFWVLKSSLIITPSLYLKRIVQGWGIPEEKIKLIYNAVKEPGTAPAAPPALFESIGRDVKKIVSVGRLMPWKGFADLIKAAGRAQAQLFIIGEGPLRPELEALIRQSGLEKRVHLAGALPREEVYRFLKHADLFVLNSSYEGLPHIVLEAMTAGAPVIATDTGGTGELVQHRWNGLLIPPEAPGALEAAIQEVLGNDALRELLVRNGHETLKRFDWRDLVDETEKTLSQAARGCAPDAAVHPDAERKQRIPVLFLSTAKFTNPPDPTLVKKWQGLRPFFDATVLSHREGSGAARQSLEGSSWILLPSTVLPRGFGYFAYVIYAFCLTFSGALKKRYRAVIAQSPFQAVAPALALLPWRIVRSSSRPRLIIEIHNDWKDGVMLYHRSRFARLEKALRGLAGRFSLSQADAYRVISDYCRNLIPADGRPVAVFPTYSDLESFREPAPAAVANMAAQYGSGVFIFAGMLIHLKGVHLLIQAFHKVLEQYPGACLVIAGKGEDEELLKGLAQQAPVGGRIHFVGHLDQKMLAAHIKNARAFVMPSLTEGLGRVAIEAHLLEVPVIASRTGGIPEIVADGETGILCEPGNCDELAAAMTALMSDPARARAMGRAGKKAVIEKFNYTTYFQSYRDMVQKSIEQR